MIQQIQFEAWANKPNPELVADLVSIFHAIPKSIPHPHGGLVDWKRIFVRLPPDRYYEAASRFHAGEMSVLEYVKRNWGLRQEQIVPCFEVGNHGVVTYVVGDGRDPDPLASTDDDEMMVDWRRIMHIMWM